MLAALLLSAPVATSASLVGCARTAEERQLEQMRAEIDDLQQSRDRADQDMLAPQAADSQAPSARLPAARPLPADEDSLTLSGGMSGASTLSGGTGEPLPADDYADTEDTAPRPSIRIVGSARGREGSGRGWRGDDQVEQSGAGDDGPDVPRAGHLDPAAAPAYDAAMALVNSRQYDKALDALAGFLVRWPDHPYANNAMYWRGECYYAKGEYRRAADQFEGTVARFPAGSKAPDALLKLGMAEQKLGDPVKAKTAFDRLTQLFPQSDAARRIPPVPMPATSRGPAPEDSR